MQYRNIEFSGLKMGIFVICKIGDIWNTEIIETFRPNWKDLGNWNKSLRKYFYKLIIASLLFCAIFQKGALARVTMMVKVDVPGIGNGFGQEIARFAKTPKKKFCTKSKLKREVCLTWEWECPKMLLYKKRPNAPTLVVVHCCPIFL